jgi:hypothetical protein
MEKKISESELKLICKEIAGECSSDVIFQTDLSESEKYVRVMKMVCRAIRQRLEFRQDLPWPYPKLGVDPESSLDNIAYVICSLSCSDYHPKDVVENSLRKIFGDKNFGINWPNCGAFL